MKKWNKPELMELNLSETGHNWFGIYRDGGYIGDGEITGHLSWDKPTPTNPCTPTPTPSTNPVTPLS